MLRASGSWAMSTIAGTASMMAASSSARARSRASLSRSVSAARSRSRNPARAAAPSAPITAAAGVKSGDPEVRARGDRGVSGAEEEGVTERRRERDGHEPRDDPAGPGGERHREQEQDEGDSLEHRPDRGLEEEHEERQPGRHGDRRDRWKARRSRYPEAVGHAREPRRRRAGRFGSFSASRPSGSDRLRILANRARARASGCVSLGASLDPRTRSRRPRVGRAPGERRAARCHRQAAGVGLGASLALAHVTGAHGCSGVGGIMVHIGDLSENMKVRARDGEELGTIIRLDARSILVEKGLFFFKDYSVPIELLREVRDGDVYLSVPAEELRRATASKFAERTLSDESLSSCTRVGSWASPTTSGRARRARAPARRGAVARRDAVASGASAPRLPRGSDPP